MIKVGINGFGRIGSLTFRAAIKADDIEVVAINAPGHPASQLAYAIKYDTVHGRFDGCVCASGSVWYPGFKDYVFARPVPPQLKGAAFSIGGKEKNTRNAVMAPIEDNMRAIAARLQEAGVAVTFATHPGGHFKDTGARLFTGICRLLGIPEA